MIEQRRWHGMAALLAVAVSGCSEPAAVGPRAAVPATGGSATGGSGQVGSGGSSNGAAGSGGGAGILGSGGAAGALASGGGLNAGGVPSAGGASAGGASGAGSPGAGAGAGGLGAAGAAGDAGAAGGAGQAQVGGQGGAGGAGEAGRGGGAGGQGPATRSISFGTLLDARAVMDSARTLAQSLSDPGSSQWRAKGDQHRSYRFAAANDDVPYRIYVPTNWDGTSNLPLAMFLHGSGSDENSYLDQNNKQMITLAQQHGYLLVSPLGHEGAYGNFLRLSAPFGDEAGAAELMAQVTAASERTNELSEQDVINVLELVLGEYPVDRNALFLFGHSMGSGGTWYLGGKYAEYWQALAPMSGPFVQKMVYPWDNIRELSVFVTEGTQTPSLDASRLLRDWLEDNAYPSEYKEVNADHGGMIPLVLPDVFDFFDRSRGAP
jgi:predicted esterase